MKRMILPLVLLFSSCSQLPANTKGRSLSSGGVNTDDPFYLRCEAVIGENPDKLVITQQREGAKDVGADVKVKRWTKVDGVQAAIDLNPFKYAASSSYLRVFDGEPVTAALLLTNDGGEELVMVEYFGQGNPMNFISLGRYSDDEVPIRIVEATGEQVNCTLESQE